MIGIMREGATARPFQLSRRAGLKRTRVGLAILLVSLIVYLLTLPRDVLPGDSGELIAASRTLSIAHPPGYPLYLLIGNIFSRLFAFGSIALRYNLLSAVAVSLMMVLLRKVLSDLVAPIVAGLVPLVIATLGSTWLQATTAEVYAFNGLITVGLLLIPITFRQQSSRVWLAIGYLGGLGISHHLTLLYPLVVSIALAIKLSGKPGPRTILVSLLLFLLGLTTWLYIPVRASLGPPLVWGRTDSLAGFLSHITGQGYRWRLREFSLAPRLRDFLGFLKLLLSQSSLPVCLLAIFGTIAALRRRTLLVGAWLALIILYGGHFAMYNIPDIASHVFPVVVPIALLAAIGLDRILELLGSWRRRHLAVGAILVAMLAYNVSAIRPRSDQWLAGDYARAIEESARRALGSDCLVITTGDASTFPLLYHALADQSDLNVYDFGASNPALIGLDERPISLEACIAEAANLYGIERIAVVGPLPAQILGRSPLICGMVNILGPPRGECLNPSDISIRGVGADLRDYSSRLLSSSYYLHLARWHAQAGDSTAFGDCIQKAVTVAHDDAGTFINAANLCLSNGLLRVALDLARKAVSIDRTFFESHDLLANVLAAMGRFREAISEYEIALKGSPNPAMVHSNLGNAYARIDEFDLALEHFSQALSLDSSLVNAYIGRARAYEGKGQFDAAIENYRHAQRLEPTSSRAYHALASLYLRLARYEDALGLLETALERIPDDPLLLSDMGLCYLRLGDLDSSIVHLEKAIEAQPNLLAAHGNLAVAYERKGLKGKAIEEYRTYLKLAPPGKLRERAAAAIQRLEGLIEDAY